MHGLSRLSWLLVAGTALAGAAGCKSESKAESNAAPEPEPVKPERFGARLRREEPVPLAKVLSDPQSYRDKALTVTGQVRRACTRRGCWMELAESMDPSKPGCRVTFKDYGFFVPTDSSGAKATAQGVVTVSTVQASHVRHLEEEGATFAKKDPDGSAQEVRFVATGVELRRQ